MSKESVFASCVSLTTYHVDACLRSLTLAETVLLLSLNLVFLGTQFSDRTIKRKFSEVLE